MAGALLSSFVGCVCVAVAQTQGWIRLQEARGRYATDGSATGVSEDGGDDALHRTASGASERGTRSQLSRLSGAEQQALLHAERKAILAGGASPFDRWAGERPSEQPPALHATASAPPQLDAAGAGQAGEQPQLGAVGKCASAV